MSTTVAAATGLANPHLAPAPDEAKGLPPAPRTADLRIDGWLVQPTLNLLTRGDEKIRLRAQLMDLLLCLASRPGKVFSKEDLLAEVWEGRWIGQSALSRCVAELRSALDDDARHPHVIETITKRGYRLIAPVGVAAIAAEPSPVLAAAAIEAATHLGVTDGVPRSFWQRLKLSAMRAALGAPGRQSGGSTTVRGPGGRCLRFGS